LAEQGAFPLDTVSDVRQCTVQFGQDLERRF
jgi:hypothetical protein